MFQIIVAFLICGLVQCQQRESEGQQIQVPVRRINIPLDLNRQSGHDQQHQRTPNKCPECLEKRLILHYMSMGCSPVIKGGCACPSRYDCPTASSRLRVDTSRDYELVNTRQSCYHNGKVYRFGEKIESEQTKCVDCYCGTTWRNDTLHESACAPVDCGTDPKTIGCTPVYSESRCCPVQHICPKVNREKIRGLQSGSHMCEFEGRKYPISAHLYTQDRCVDCVCRVPPQFTCTKKRFC